MEHRDWKDWSFDYGVIGTEGLSLLNGSFRGRRIFAKLSLPVIRVKYVRDEKLPLGAESLVGVGCGPYNDHIRWDTPDVFEGLSPYSDHLVRLKDCGNRYICVREHPDERLELGVYMRIGAYHIYQAWFLGSAGTIQPLVFSKGLSCSLDHRHHPYWRFHFQLDGSLVSVSMYSMGPSGWPTSLARDGC